MKNKFVLFYSILATILLVFSVGFFGFNLYREYTLGVSRTNRTFTKMVSQIKATSYQNDMNSSEYPAKLFHSIENFDDIAFLEVKKDGISLFTYPSSQSKDSKSHLISTFAENCDVRNHQLEITAALYLLRPASIHYYAKISFLMILIVTMATVILIIYIQMKESAEDSISNAKEIVEEGTESIETQETEETPADTENNAAQKSNDDESTDEEETTSDIENTPPQNDGTGKKAEALEEKEGAADIENDLHAEGEKDESALEENNEKQAKPEGLFSDITGFGWQEYLMPRLENELNRAIASEMDISLFIFQIPDSERTSGIIKNTCNYLALQFQFKDLLFEYKDDCLVAMKISMNLDEALNFAEKLHADITNIITAEGKQCFIGISTRSIRMVTAERLFTEAEQALEHAKEDKDSPIIAFRADAEKYRKYLDENR